MIPRRLYHFWLSDQPESPLAQKCMATWDRLGFEVEHVTLANCDRSTPLVRELLAENTPQSRVRANDFLRVQYLYERGGLYLDNDVEVLRDFDDLLTNGCFLGAQDSETVNMAVLGAERRHWFLRECLDAMLAAPRNISPVAFSLGNATRIAKSWGWFRDRDFEALDLHIYPSKVFYPYPWNGKFTPECIRPETRAIHHWGFSWKP